jgi:hypothetical protein
MQRLLPFVSGVLGVLSLSIFSLASCGGEHFDRALIENSEAGADHQPVADASDGGADLDSGGGRPDVRDTPPSEGTTCPPNFGGDLLYTFDTMTGTYTGKAPPLSALPPSGNWFAYAEMGGSAGLLDGSTAWSETEGHSCPGSVALTANFTVYGGSEKTMALVNFGANWATPKAYARLHAWVKVAIPPSTGTLDHLDQILLATNTNNYNAFQGAPLSASTFADGDWHEIVRELIPGTTYYPASVNQVGVQISARGVAPASPSAPVPTTIYIDDLWLEQ